MISIVEYFVVLLPLVYVPLFLIKVVLKVRYV